MVNSQNSFIDVRDHGRLKEVLVSFLSMSVRSSSLDDVIVISVSVNGFSAALGEEIAIYWEPMKPWLHSTCLLVKSW